MTETMLVTPEESLTVWDMEGFIPIHNYPTGIRPDDNEVGSIFKGQKYLYGGGVIDFTNAKRLKKVIISA